ncbi:hypothetical protein QR680_000021 [Steinernema hermaphroditum]|uniref:Uncharacterized protein n=1 Tax=Steinernema hermaphroditum TaxID=289476 RepID=A0AA39GTU3_9BILA|nr:hypothetical protein QR680_000021 [Steinernema hermaphroditum]
MCTLPSGADLDKEKQRYPGLLGAGFPSAFLGMPPTATPPTSSSVFPPNISHFQSFLNPHFQQYCATFLQHQNLIQQFAQQQNQSSPQGRIDLSPSISDSQRSTVDSPSTKKLPTDNEGNAMCPVCDVKLPVDEDWLRHLESEKANLLKSIETLKEYKPSTVDVLNLACAANDGRRKREYELHRIKNNQQKRLAAKSILVRETLTPFSRQSNDSGSNCCSPSGKIDQLFRSSTFCKTCERHHEFLVISNQFDEPRCQDCYMKLRHQAGALPSTITQSPIESLSPLMHEKFTSSPLDIILSGNGSESRQSNDSSETSEPDEKRAKPNC